jgi:ComF family protein
MYSFFEYQEPSGLVRRLLKLLKYQSMESISKCFEDILLPFKRLFRKDWGFKKNIYYVPVPLHWRRQCERGFNQATVLANIFKKIWPGEVVENLFVRNQYTIAQASLGREDRLENLRGKFTLQPKVLEKLNKNAQFILVDDVITTGSTMWALVEELKKAGVNDFLALSLARD